MRVVNIKTGLKQRIGDILGHNDNDTTGVLTPWSIQAAMLSNVQRVATGVVGEAACGRIMKGLVLTYQNPNYISVTQGYGFTPEGNVAYLTNDLNNIPVSTSDGTYYLYLKHSLIQATESLPYPHEYGKNTEFNSQTGTEEIVYDNIGLVNNSRVSAADVISVETSALLQYAGRVYLGQVTIASGVIVENSIIPSTDLGISPSNFLLDKQVLSDTFSGSSASEVISLPTNFTIDNTVILYAALKGTGASVFPNNTWLVIPYSRAYISSSDLITLNIYYQLSSGPSIYLYAESTAAGVSGTQPDFNGVTYKFVIGRRS